MYLKDYPHLSKKSVLTLQKIEFTIPIATTTLLFVVQF